MPDMTAVMDCSNGSGMGEWFGLSIVQFSAMIKVERKVRLDHVTHFVPFASHQEIVISRRLLLYQAWFNHRCGG